MPPFLPSHRSLPMAGHTHGTRSAVTCALKCDSACAHPAPNEDAAAPSFHTIASRQLSRRAVLAGSGAVAALTVVPAVLDGSSAAAHPSAGNGKAGFSFAPIPAVPAGVDALTVPQGWTWEPIVRWGDPLFADSPAFDPTTPSAAAQARQFGYNNDYLDILVDRGGRRALLCCNHEYTNRDLMFPPSADQAGEREVLRATMAAVGFSVVALERPRRGAQWRYRRGARPNRRLTATTPFRLTGAAAGSDLVRTQDDPSGRTVLGTFANCAGGTTPWGTILSGEENFNGYFVADPTRFGNARYGLTDSPSTTGWEAVESRFDATQEGYVNEPNRFGYIVEIDPYDPASTPRKHTALGRFKHEGANVRVDADGTVVAYMGDDERFDYLYKFVAKKKFRPGRSASARRHNMSLLTEGNLYVARFSGVMKPDHDNLGTGTWVPLTLDGDSAVPGFSHAEVLVYTRLAADKVMATPMDRCEDVEPSPRTGKVYVACTNNTRRGVGTNPPADPANPRVNNKNGHIIEIAERRNRADATTFTWNLFLVCGDPAEAGTYFGGWDGPVAPISCPDNIAFDSANNLWVATDGAPGTISKADGLFRVPLEGPERGHLVQFLAVPFDAETCGPVIHDRDGSVFVAVQHPGEEGSWEEPQSYFPDYVPAGESAPRGAWRGPRPSVVQVTKR